MKVNSFLQTCLLIFFLSCTIFWVPSAAVVKGAYWPSYREIPLSSIDTRYFTHLYYAFLIPDNVTFSFNIDSAKAQSLRDFTTTLHGKNPPIKALYSIGGGGNGVEPAGLLTKIASTPSLRSTFIASSIKVARDYGFDGMDLDWESPKDDIEMGYFSSLIDDWRAAIIKESQTSGKPQLLLTAAVYFASRFLFDNKQSYPVASINKNMDWINAMCYDFHGEDKTKTGAPAALFDPNSNVSCSYGIKSWIQSGLSKNKLVLGIPLHGMTRTLKDPNVSGVGAPAVGIGPSGDGGTATLLYYEIVAYIAKNNARVVLDLPTGSAYAVNGNIWIGYDSTDSTAMKVRYAQSQGILGYFLWALTFDVNSQISSAASNSWT